MSDARKTMFVVFPGHRSYFRNNFQKALTHIVTAKIEKKNEKRNDHKTNYLAPIDYL